MLSRLKDLRREYGRERTAEQRRLAWERLYCRPVCLPDERIVDERGQLHLIFDPVRELLEEE